MHTILLLVIRTMGNTQRPLTEMEKIREEKNYYLLELRLE